MMGREPRSTPHDRAVAPRTAEAHDDSVFRARAARAFQLRTAGDYIGAIASVSEVHRAAPHLELHVWIARWVEEAHARGMTIDPAPLIRALAVGLSFGAGRICLLPGERAAAEELVPLARTAMASLPDDGRISSLASSILRRAARHEEALEVAERASTTLSTEHGQALKGLALRALKKFDLALDAFEAAFASSADPLHLMEKVRVMADAGRWSDALREWERLDALRAVTEPSSEELLLEMATIRDAAKRKLPTPAEAPLDQVRRRALAHGHLWRMTDATANALRKVGENGGLRAQGPARAGSAIRSGRIEIAMIVPEGPSNRLCQALMLRGEPDLRLATYRGPEPKVDGAARYPLWRRTEVGIVQAMPTPPNAVSEWIASVVLPDSDGTVSEGAFETASDFLDIWNFAGALRLPNATASDWVAAAVHPRMPLCRVCCAPEWVYRWQVGALVGLALSESEWEGSARRDAFWSLLDQPLDWPVAAAIRVLAEIGLREPETTREIRQRLIDLSYELDAEPNDGMTRTLLGALEMLPYVPTNRIDRLRSRLPDDGPRVEPAAPAKSTKSAARPWWKLWGNS